ncbi:hypothetical protein ZWY2020_027920 [Hordeum vulgare]|nr:hypothetical protein ZWY2020_027920 [Hordeum vulgare]
MGELMDTLTRYAEAYDTKDPGEYDDKINTAKRGEFPRGHSQFQGRGYHHPAGQGKRRPQEGVTDFVANTSSGNINQCQPKRGFSRKKPRNYYEMLKGPCPQHATADGPATHSWEDCYVMQEFRAETLKRGQGGNHAGQQECFGAAYAESGCAADELKFHQANVEPTDMMPLKKPTIDSEPPLKFKPMDDTKVVGFTPGDSSKQFTIGTSLDPK